MSSNKETMSGKGCRLLTASNVKAFMDSIDTILCDCDGVLYHTNNLVPGVAETVHKLKSLGKRFFYVTNNSTKTRKEFLKKFALLGLPAEEDDVVGSAYVTALCIREKYNYKGKVFVVGASGLAEELQMVGLKTLGAGTDNNIESSFKAAEDYVPDPEVKCVVMGVDENFNYLKASKAATYLANKDCLFIGTNPDTGLPALKGHVLPGAGACIAMVEVASQRKADLICGKPHKTMFDVVMKKYQLNPKKTLMIGDRLDTDILFAGQSGLQSLLVLTGFSSLEDVKQKQKSQSPIDQKHVPDYYLPSLADLHKLLNDL